MNSIQFSGADRAAPSAPLVLPQTGTRGVAAIVLLPAIAGVNDYVRRVAHRVAAGGFAVAILDFFAREGRAPDVSTPVAIDVAVNPLADRRVISDACGLVGALREHEAIDPERVGLPGSCIGGMYSLMLSAETSDLSASVDFYDSVRYSETSSHKPMSPLDRVIRPAHFRSRHRRARGRAEARAPAYRPVASQLAWQRTMTFLDWHLKGLPAR